jgi:hypothetical protein
VNRLLLPFALFAVVLALGAPSSPAQTDIL